MDRRMQVGQTHSAGGVRRMFIGYSFLPFPFLSTLTSKMCASVKSSTNKECERRIKFFKRGVLGRGPFVLRH